MPSCRRFPFAIMATVVGLAAGIGGAELTVRAWETLADTSEEFTYAASQQFKRLHQGSACPGLPYELRPGATARVSYGGGSVVEYRINRLGMRGPEPTTNPVLRILLLGDSVTFGYYVREESTFASLLPGYIGGSAQVDNGAVGGYNTYTELQWYRCHGRDLSPDAVVVCFCPNDLDDPYGHFTWHTLEAMGSIPESMCPDPRRSWQSSEERRRKAASVWWNRWWRLRKASRAIWRATVFLNRRVGSGRRPFLHCLKAMSDPASLELGWLRRGIVDFADEVPDSTSLLVAIIPLRYQLEDQTYDESLRSVSGLTAELGLPCLNLLPVLREAGTSCFLDASHLSPTGHRVVAEALGSFLTGGTFEQSPHHAS